MEKVQRQIRGCVLNVLPHSICCQVRAHAVFLFTLCTRMSPAMSLAPLEISFLTALFRPTLALLPLAAVMYTFTKTKRHRYIMCCFRLVVQQACCPQKTTSFTSLLTAVQAEALRVIPVVRLSKLATEALAPKVESSSTLLCYLLVSHARKFAHFSLDGML